MRLGRIIIVAGILLSATVSANAQNDQSFVDFYKQRAREFKDWRMKANQEFADYLAAAWQEFMVNRGRPDPIGPVADEPEYYELKGVMPLPHGVPSSGMMFTPVVLQLPAVVADFNGGNAVTVDFYGIVESIPFSSEMRLPRIMATEQDASNGWKHLSQADFMPTVNALNEIVEEYALSDWALCTIIKKMTDALYIDEYVNEKVLTQMFLLSQLQYKVRIGSSGGELLLLLPFDSPIYQVSYITDNNEDFYIFSYSRLNSQNPLYSFSEDFSAADRELSLVIDKPMSVSYDYYRVRTMERWAKYLEDEVKVPLNYPAVQFTLNYPQSDLLTYHKSAIDPELEKAVFTVLRYKIIKDGMDPLEAVSFILTLIQYGFDYKTDYEMFGRSKPLFVEESFYYGANNCKDRVLVFSWLVQDLLGLDVVMFCYDGHVACGVAFQDDVAGDAFNVDGVRYVMCDPTYIGAPVGATMTKFRGVLPQVVRL